MTSPQDVPKEHRDRVLATDIARPRAERLGERRVLVLDLRQQEEGAPANYSVVDLEGILARPRRAPPKDHGELARRLVADLAGQVRKELGIEEGGPGSGEVILYSAPWCGFCKKAAEYLRSKGVAFDERNIDDDREAALELSHKLSAAGLSDSGIPVLDIHGTIVVGFKKDQIDKLLSSP